MSNQNPTIPEGPEVWPDDKPFAPPEGTMIIRPFKGLMKFWPNDQADRPDTAWVQWYEQRYLAPLGAAVAQVFQVDLINDAEYIGMPDDAQASFLSCVLTRSQIREVHPGIHEWYPLCVVVKRSIVAAVQVRVDPANQKIEIPRALVWAARDQEYCPVVDPQSGKIENPAVLLGIFARYAELEFGILPGAGEQPNVSDTLIIAP